MRRGRPHRGYVFLISINFRMILDQHQNSRVDIVMSVFKISETIRAKSTNIFGLLGLLRLVQKNVRNCQKKVYNRQKAP